MVRTVTKADSHDCRFVTEPRLQIIHALAQADVDRDIRATVVSYGPRFRNLSDRPFFQISFRMSLPRIRRGMTLVPNFACPVVGLAFSCQPVFMPARAA